MNAGGAWLDGGIRPAAVPSNHSYSRTIFSERIPFNALRVSTIRRERSTRA